MTPEGNHPPCPEGFDPAKWAKMTLEEKCRHLGLDVKEWLRMSREQQMQRINKFASDFHFYAMDKVKQADHDKHPGTKTWHI